MDLFGDAFNAGQRSHRAIPKVDTELKIWERLEPKIQESICNRSAVTVPGRALLRHGRQYQRPSFTRGGMLLPRAQLARALRQRKFAPRGT